MPSALNTNEGKKAFMDKKAADMSVECVCVLAVRFPIKLMERSKKMCEGIFFLSLFPYEIEKLFLASLKLNKIHDENPFRFSSLQKKFLLFSILMKCPIFYPKLLFSRRFL